MAFSLVGKKSLLQVLSRSGWLKAAQLLSTANPSLVDQNYCPVLPERLQQIEDSPSGWVPPLDPPPDLPFYIRRSRTNNVPVYTDFKSGRTRIITILRKVSGDLEETEKFIKSVLGDETICKINEVTSCIKIKGNHQKTLIQALQEIGF